MCKFAEMDAIIRCNRDGENRVLTLKVGLSCWDLIDSVEIVLIGKVFECRGECVGLNFRRKVRVSLIPP
jgi:hypothetical protein